jgi:hypothetical protein
MTALTQAATLIATDVHRLARPGDDPTRAAALTLTYACGRIDGFIVAAGIEPAGGQVMALAARSLMLDMVAYRLLESAGGAP